MRADPRCRKTGLLAAFLVLVLASEAGAQERVLRVCADPNNLPFSNQAEEGFENRIVELVATELHARVEYVWWAQRRGYIRNTLGAGTCDLWPGIASTVEQVAVTRPYYRSTYVFVSRADRRLDLRSYDDSRLAEMTIGVQMVGDDGANTPPAHALARRGHTNNVRGYMLYGDYRKADPPRAIVDAVARGDIDIAVVWGPLAGYFAAKAAAELAITPVQPRHDGERWPMTFDISMGVRHGDAELRMQLDEVLFREADAIRRILAAYNVPLVDAGHERQQQDTSPAVSAQ